MSRGLVARLGVGLCVCSACSSGSPTDLKRIGDDAAVADDAAVVPVACTAVPRKIVDFVSQVPDAGRTGIEMPLIAVSPTDVYYVLNWSTAITPSQPSGSNSGRLMRASLRSARSSSLADIPGGGYGGTLAVTSKAVIFNQMGDASEPAAVVSVPLEGGAKTVLARTTGNYGAIVADAENVYFVDADGTHKVSQEGGTAELLSPAIPGSLGVIEGSLYLADGMSVSSVPLAGGSTKALATGQPGAEYPVPCEGVVCWTNGALVAGTLQQLDPDGSVKTLAQDMFETHDLLFDGRDFFATVGGGGAALVRVPGGGGSTLAVHKQTGMTGLALDENCLYWSSFDGIFAVARSTAESSDAGF